MEPQTFAESSPHSSSPLIRRSRIPDWVLLAAVCAFFFFWKLAAFGLIGADEPRYAQVAREMLARHDWITPTLGGSPWLEKPPLYYWQAMIAYKIFGVSDWAARLPSAFDALLAVFAIYWFLLRFRRGAELDGALIAATLAGVVGYARAASMDMPLAAMLTIAMLAWYAWYESRTRSYLLIFYAFVALGMIAKGPVAPFLAAVIIGFFAVSQRKLAILARTISLPGIVLFLAVGLPWYVLAQLRNPQFFRIFILEHNLARFGTNLYHHPEPFWYYLLVLLLGWVPWSVLTIASIFAAVRQARKQASDPLNAFASIWIATTVVFFSISQSKLPGYILPAVPAGALLLANYLRMKAAEKPSPWLALAHSLLTAALFFFALMIRYVVLEPTALWGHAAVVPAFTSLTVAIVLFVVLWKAGYRTLRIATLIPAILVLAITLHFGAAPIEDKLSARSLVNAILEYDHHRLPIAAYLVPRETEFGLAFYRDQVIPRYELGQVPDGEHILVAAQGYPKGVTRTAGRKAVLLRNFTPQKLDLYYVPAR